MRACTTLSSTPPCWKCRPWWLSNTKTFATLDAPWRTLRTSVRGQEVLHAISTLSHLTACENKSSVLCAALLPLLEPSGFIYIYGFSVTLKAVWLCLHEWMTHLEMALKKNISLLDQWVSENRCACRKDKWKPFGVLGFGGNPQVWPVSRLMSPSLKVRKLQNLIYKTLFKNVYINTHLLYCSIAINAEEQIHLLTAEFSIF